MEQRALRADAARNVEQLRAAAIAAFRGRGLDTPLDEVAKAAGVSKATIYNRFGGRQGLIDAVIGELVAVEMTGAMERAAKVADPWERVAAYVTDCRDLHYREPVAGDVVMMRFPDSPELMRLCVAATDAGEEFMRQAHAAGVVRPDFTVGDLYHAFIEGCLALRHWPKPPREDYDRRTRFLLDGMRAR
ncbi:TetR family transcriptional regulator [Actinorhabdospora filicis]|uniref:TetR family transcriptional regulator n=1 Tax=Actinorhabdospora filicis TaxID=1785913 RepID=A0A9W6SK23_9ACTN|nr:TetR/AcrR family transcriptional regulator [Actinorhabdospora filicis]GLZ77116.1 TetR family transcriptional regulator [Actinorhabdospora filicis]